jgi:cytochrome bd-type quinol oxidase subunit 2
MNPVYFLLIVIAVAVAATAWTAAQAQEISADRYSYEQALKAVASSSTDQPANATASKLGINNIVLWNDLAQVLVLSVVTVICLAMVLRYMKAHSTYSPTNVMHASALIFLIYGTVFLVIISQIAAQLSAAMGIFGSIAGYVWGRTQRREDDRPTIDKT